MSLYKMVKFLNNKLESYLEPDAIKTNPQYIGQWQNHKHLCELKMVYGGWNKCPYNFKDCLNDECDKCNHMRIINLTDDGLHITNIE